MWRLAVPNGIEYTAAMGCDRDDDT